MKMHEYLKKQVLPFTCFTHRSAYLSVLRVLLLPLLLFSDGKCIFSSFRVLKSSFCVLALADCSLLQSVHETDTRASRNDKVSPALSQSGKDSFLVCRAEQEGGSEQRIRESGMTGLICSGWFVWLFGTLYCYMVVHRLTFYITFHSNK